MKGTPGDGRCPFILGARRPKGEAGAVAKSKYAPYVLPRFQEIQAWLEAGLTERQIARNLGVSKTSFETYKRKYPDFLALIKKGRGGLVRELENALVKRALGYEYIEEKTYIRTEGGKQVQYVERTRKHMPPDVAALAILLKNKDKENWADNPQMVDLRRQMLELEKRKVELAQW